MEFLNEYSKRIKKIDNYIENYIDSITDTQPNLKEAIKYAVLNGGKRLRSILCIEFAKLNDVNEDLAYAFACAIEFIHAYSLVHDDLPCMDDDDFRRGMPSCHKKYGEGMAVLVGDALLTLAFDIMSFYSEKCEYPKNCIKAINFVACKAGMCGMINGQVIDINNTDNKNADYDLLLKLVDKKTSELICASVVTPAILAGVDDKKIKKFSEFASNLGIAFQIRDDFEDVEQDGGDDGSPNFINILGQDKARKTIVEYVKKCDLFISEFDNNEFLCEFFNYLFADFV